MTSPSTPQGPRSASSRGTPQGDAQCKKPEHPLGGKARKVTVLHRVYGGTASWLHTKAVQDYGEHTGQNTNFINSGEQRSMPSGINRGTHVTVSPGIVASPLQGPLPSLLPVWSAWPGTLPPSVTEPSPAIKCKPPLFGAGGACSAWVSASREKNRMRYSLSGSC